ncbi:MAG: malto-oligosyltrehalose synthase [Pseudomonadota bacterium]|nr:malto-oligosyltrehalose synthase [Pseudomonadota bacterium]
MNDALHRLAEHYGIAPEFVDIWGKTHRTDDKTLRQLLAAMRIDAGDDGAAVAALAHAQALEWSEALPPVVVWRPGVPHEVRIRCETALLADLSYRVDEENGAQHSGEIDTGGRDPIARAVHEGRDHAAYDVNLGVALPGGYHRLTLMHAERVLGTSVLIVAPAACYQPATLAAGGRIFGPGVQLYAVRSDRNWGIGDFTDLASIVEQWAAQGAAIVGTNPLHALFPHDPSRASPYSPSSRLFLNTLYLDVEAIADFAHCKEARTRVQSSEFQERLRELRAKGCVDYHGVAQAKREILRLLAGHFRAHHLDRATARAASFRSFVLQGGEALERLAIFEALQEHLHERDANVWGWPVWPEAYRDHDAAMVGTFAKEHADRVDEALYLQWQADLQLQAVAERAHDLGLDVGVYRDLAVSIDGGGAESWSNPQIYAMASVGAPPDIFSPQGQNWGLPPIIPAALRRSAYAPFIATLRANMRHAGALRIDHVMGLARLYWVPDGNSAAKGAYVRYPLDDLMAVLALESQRQHCLVVGEDLGTVPDEVRTALRDANVLSYRLLWFERQDDAFAPPGQYPAQALVAVTTHDLPTLAGWWLGRDIEARETRGLFADPGAASREHEQRARDRMALLEALTRAGIPTPEWHPGAPVPEHAEPELARRIQEFLGSSPAQVMIVQLEDVVGVEEQVNLPGTTDSHPNWQMKLPVTLEHWMDDQRFEALTRTLRRVRRAPAASRERDSMQPARVPRSTYRLQLHRDFTLRDAAAIVPYLAALGVSHVYCSPYLRARPGSRHGYDIVDHGALNPEIGDTSDLDAFVAALREHGMGHILDMVPNHMGVMGSDNAWWMDVLENGPASIYADHFDIDWTPRDHDAGPRVLIPILGDHYGNVLERGELRLGFEPATGAFAVRYYAHRLPLDPRTYGPLLERARQCAGALDPSVATRLSALLAGVQALPSRHAISGTRMQARHEAKESLKAQLARLVSDNPHLATGIECAVAEWNGTPGDAASVSALHELLEAQAFRVSFWRVASDEINYRRFFDINDLAALRVENEAVFQETHRFVMTLAATGKIDGLRIDHPDGLHDPARYFARLQEAYATATGSSAETAARDKPLYVVVEKILAGHEELPGTWAVHGTTGYRFANLVTGLFVDTTGKARVDRAWKAFLREEAVDFDDAVDDGKRTVMQTTLGSELNVLTHRLLQIARADRHTRDFTLNALRQALIDVTAAFPVYRTYVNDTVAPHDRRHIEWAVARARRRSRAADVSVFEFIRRVLLMRSPPHAGDALKGAYRAFAMRFQQFTAPVTAKGIEDTALYAFTRLVSLNDVGGDPDRFGTSVSAFHAANAHRAQHWPHTLIASSTHDNKRSEDVRARIDLISEMPGAWRLLTRRWSRINRSKKRIVDGDPAPSRNDEYLIYQTLLGSFPSEPLDDTALAAYRERIRDYAIKAAREAKIRTSWINVNAEYEEALTGFVNGLLAPGERNLFMDDIRNQLPFLSWFGLLNSLAMTVMKLTSPGVPDIYQGNEFIDLSLVDPDNRRAIDYGVRREKLAELQRISDGASAETLASEISSLLETDASGAKLWVTLRTLQLRVRMDALFRDGNYTPLRVTGSRARHVIAFARAHEGQACIVVAGRLFSGLGQHIGTLPDAAQWDDTCVLVTAPRGPAYVDELTRRRLTSSEGRLYLSDVLKVLPVALLVP